jgi:hypothetical protein
MQYPQSINKPRRWRIVLGGMLLLVITPAAFGHTVSIVSENQAGVCLDFRPEIVKSLRLEPQVEEFIAYICEMTGVRLPARSDEGDATGLVPVRLEYLGPVEPHQRMNTQLIQGYQINVGTDAITITAHSRLGFQNALYALLDRWGCRWVMIGKIGEVIPRHDTLTLPVGVIQSAPSYNSSMQSVANGSGPVADWWRRNRGGAEYRLSGQHYWFYAMPPDKHFKEHPEWYSLIGGKRVPRQLCTTNPEVISKMVEVAKQYFQKMPTALAFPIDPWDNLDYCQCERCRALDPKGVDERGLPYVTDRVVHFANAVATGIAKEWPDKYVAFYAYNNHTEPPVNVMPDKRVCVGITRSRFCLLHLTPNDGCQASKDYYELVAKWEKLCPGRVWTYEYEPISWTGGLPCPIYLERGASIAKLFNKCGIVGGWTDCVPAYNKPLAATYINTYMERRMKSDPSQDPREVLADMCGGFFGPAAESMEKYYLELSKVIEHKHPDRYAVGFGADKYHEMFNKEMIANARVCMDNAISAASGKEPYAERVRLVDLSQQYLEAYLGGVWFAQAGDYQKSVDAFERVGKLIDELEKADAIDAKDARRRIYNTARLKIMAEHFPDKLGFVRKWKILGPFDNSRRDASWRDDPFEPVASIDKPVRLRNGNTMRWVNFESTQGHLEMDVFVQRKNAPWNISYAYAENGVRESQRQRHGRTHCRMGHARQRPEVCEVPARQRVQRRAHQWSALPYERLEGPQAVPRRA